MWNGNVTGRCLGVHEAGSKCEICVDRGKDGKDLECCKEVVHNDFFMDGPSRCNDEVPEDGDDVFEGTEVFGEVEDDIVTPETMSDGLDDEVPEDRDEEDPTGRPMVTM